MNLKTNIIKIKLNFFLPFYMLSMFILNLILSNYALKANFYRCKNVLRSLFNCILIYFLFLKTFENYFFIN